MSLAKLAIISWNKRLLISGKKVNWIKDYCDENDISFSDHKANGFMNRDELLKKLNKCGSRNLKELTETEIKLKNLPAAT